MKKRLLNYAITLVLVGFAGWQLYFYTGDMLKTLGHATAR
jgi:hypothetical protein